MSVRDALTDAEFEAMVEAAATPVEIKLRLLRALGMELRPGVEASLRSNPLAAELAPPLPSHARFYTFRATAHESERDRQTWKVQITVGERRSRNRFDWSDAHMAYLLGWVPELDVWIVYDAEAQQGSDGFPYSKSCYVDRGDVYSAFVTGSGESITTLKDPTRDEHILIARPARLVEALSKRHMQHLGIRNDD